MEKWVEILLPILIAEIIGLGSLIWKLASTYGELKRADFDNKKDINNLGKKVNKIDDLTWQRIDNIEEFLQELPTPSSMRGFQRRTLKVLDQ